MNIMTKYYDIVEERKWREIVENRVNQRKVAALEKIVRDY